MPFIMLLQPGCRIDFECMQPYILSPLMSTMQTISVNHNGAEPDFLEMINRSYDDLNLVDHEVFDGMSTTARKAYFSKR